MESSDSDDEEDRVSVRRRDQIDRKAREDDYFRFVSDLSEEDYILMRDNNLLGPLGESTEEELLQRLQLMKENLRQNSDENPERHASDDTSSDDSVLDCLTTSGQTENVTSEQKECLSWGEDSQSSANSDELRFGLERNLDPDDENSNPEDECVASAKLPRREDTEDSQRQVENPQSEPLFTTPSASEQDTMETLMEVPLTRSQRRLRSRSPVYRRTRARTDSWSPPHSRWEFFPSINEDIPSQTFKEPLICENETFSRTGHEETLRQQMPGHELQNRDLTETSKTRNAAHEECDSDTTCSSESWEVMETNLTTPFNLEVERVHCPACSLIDSRISRTQLTSDSLNITTTSESEEEVLQPMLSYSDEGNESASVNTIRNPVHRILNITTVSFPSISWQTMIGFSYSSNLMDSDSNLEHSVSPPSENIERAESPNERHGPSGSESRPGSASNARYNPDLSLIVISDSSPYSISSSASSPILISSSNDEDSETSSLILVENEERILSTGLSETGQERGRMTPIILDDSDSGSSISLDDFLLLNEADPHQTTGLTTTQIDNLPLRYFAENDSHEVCTICITEYTAGNMLRILPCSHEYHCACIDRWLEEHSSCPICRGPVVDPPEADNYM
ncbi:E3 ubiquitin-protein ligase RLIM-like [Dama dama]|uniref:E3 ubiquitin-protein ligase RLIM-like n=1 Tax=Dama dama TaxID=30532 RepID=UPI002A368E9C|nr:E3 ubiquitin-protein ligase RLIM-like [Dama dama]